jgi:hypothetical protein
MRRRPNASSALESPAAEVVIEMVIGIARSPEHIDIRCRNVRINPDVCWPAVAAIAGVHISRATAHDKQKACARTKEQDTEISAQC